MLINKYFNKNYKICQEKSLCRFAVNLKLPKEVVFMAFLKHCRLYDGSVLLISFRKVRDFLLAVSVFHNMAGYALTVYCTFALITLTSYAEQISTGFSYMAVFYKQRTLARTARNI